MTMDKIRDFLQSKIGRALMILFLSPVVLVGFEGLLQGGSLAPNELAKVGEKSIVSESLQDEANNIRHRLTEQGIDGGLIDEHALNAQAFENLMAVALIEAQAKALGMQVSDETITRILQQDPLFLDADGKFSNDLFARFLTQNRMNKDALFANSHNQLNIRQLNASVLNASIFPKTQVSRLIDLQTESRPVWVKRLDWQAYAPKVAVGDAEIASYYERNKASLNSPALVDLVYLVLDDNALPAPAIDDTALNTAYTSYLKNNNLLSPELAQILLTGDDAKARAEQVASELKAGKDFAELAKTHSDDPSGKTGGNIGSFNPAVFGADASKVEQALTGLGAGKVSEPVQTAFGWQIFKVLKVPQAPTLDELKPKLLAQLKIEQQQAQKSDLIAKINGMAVDGYALKDIATELKLSTQTLTDYPKTDNQTALNQPIVIATAFDETLVGSQSVSGNLEVNGQTMWVQPSNYRKSEPMTLDQAKTTITAILTKQKASELALADAQVLVQNFKKDSVSDFVALGNINRNSPVLSDDEKAELFAKPATKDNLVAWAVLTDTGASVLVGGDINTESTARMSDAERTIAGQMMREIAGQDHLEDYLHHLRQTLPIKTNAEALKNF